MSKIKEIRRYFSRLLESDIARFGVVGFMGFTISSVLLFILYDRFSLNIVFAQLISGEGGLLSNFYWHNKWTYKNQKHQGFSLITKLWKFHLSSWSGIFILTILVTLQVGLLKVHYLLALAIAAAVVMVWNYFWTKFYIFKGNTPEVLHSPEATMDFSLKGETRADHK